MKGVGKETLNVGIDNAFLSSVHEKKTMKLNAQTKKRINKTKIKRGTKPTRECISSIFHANQASNPSTPVEPVPKSPWDLPLSF
jgi:hypothetical protein